MSVKMKDNGWTALQEANPEKHILEINCRAENGMVVEVRIRHNDGEEFVATVSYDGKPALPMSIKDFQKHFDKYELDMR